MLIDKLAEKIRKQILAGEIPANQKIHQQKLAEKLGVSRTPVVNALEILRGKGLVERIPSQGYYVKSLGPEECVELMRFRKLIEPSICYELCFHISDEQVAFLQEIFQVHYQCYQEQERIDEKSYQNTDMVFHDTLLEYSQNAIAQRINQDIQYLSKTYLKGLIRTPEETILEHMEIVDALVERQAAGAMQAMYQHLDKSEILLKKSLEIYQKIDEAFRPPRTGARSNS